MIPDRAMPELSALLSIERECCARLLPVLDASRRPYVIACDEVQWAGVGAAELVASLHASIGSQHRLLVLGRRVPESLRVAVSPRPAEVVFLSQADLELRHAEVASMFADGFNQPLHVGVVMAGERVRTSWYAAGRVGCWADAIAHSVVGQWLGRSYRGHGPNKLLQKPHRRRSARLQTVTR